jgi:hypothetical protein
MNERQKRSMEILFGVFKEFADALLGSSSGERLEGKEYSILLVLGRMPIVDCNLVLSKRTSPAEVPTQRYWSCVCAKPARHLLANRPELARFVAYSAVCYLLGQELLFT